MSYLRIDSYSDSTFSPPSNCYLSAKTWGRVRRRVVFASIDVVLFLRKPVRIVLGKRRNRPYAKGFWICGGRLTPQDKTAAKAAARKLNLEISLPIKPSRISNEVIHIHFHHWADGSCGFAPVLPLEITEKEFERLQKGISRSPEFSELCAFDAYQVQYEKSLHPAIQDLAPALIRYVIDTSP